MSFNVFNRTSVPFCWPAIHSVFQSRCYLHGFWFFASWFYNLIHGNYFLFFKWIFIKIYYWDIIGIYHRGSLRWTTCGFDTFIYWNIITTAVLANTSIVFYSYHLLLWWEQLRASLLATLTFILQYWCLQSLCCALHLQNLL